MTGTGFLPGQFETITINSIPVDALQVDLEGDLIATLVTLDSLPPGTYHVAVGENPHTTTNFAVDPQAPLQQPTPTGEIVQVNMHPVFVPQVSR
jgi:hypothetical protein